LEARRGQRLHTVKQFTHGRTALQVIEVVESAGIALEKAVQDSYAREPPPAPAACKEGCAWCCYKMVGTSAAEVLRIVSYLEQTLLAEEWQALRERVARGAEQRRALSPDRRRRAALPCPLLVDNRCAAYPVRPLTCRGYNSSDAGACQAALDAHNRATVPAYEPQQRLATFVLDGLRAGLNESRLDGELLELTSALQIALETPDVLQRWLAGERIFASARFP
jgi:Fe-S-cluster containining protein